MYQKSNDTLNVQIDKLSEAIESMMKGFSTLQTPKVLDSELTRIKPNNLIQVGLTGDSDLSEPDSFCKDQEYDLEKSEVSIERVTMVNEDFRSFEARSELNSSKMSISSTYHLNILEEISKKINKDYGISLAYTNVDDFISEIQKIIEKPIECSLVELHCFILSLCDLVQKEAPSYLKLQLGGTAITLNVKERPRRRFQKPDYSVQYEPAIEKLLQDKDLPEEIKNIGRVKKNLLVNIDLEKLRKLDIDSLREDLEQKIADVELAKKRIITQVESLSRFSRQLRQKDIDIVKLKDTLEYERGDIEEERKKIKDFEKKYSMKINEIKMKIFELCPELSIPVELKPRSSIDTASTGRISPLVAQVRTMTPVNLQSTSEPNELTSLQNELASLESLPQDNSTQLRINRLKTQISSIRSATAINNSLRKSASTLGKPGLDHRRNSSNGSNVDLSICASPFNRSGCSSPIVPDILYNSANLKKAPLRPPAQAFKKPGPKPKEAVDEIEAIKNQLKLQESRVKEREELVDEKENRLQRTWMRMPNGEELVGLVQKELKYLGVIRKDWEDKFEDLNAELVMLAKRVGQVRNKERELEGKIVEAGKEKKGLEDEKGRLESRFEAILTMIDAL